MVCYVTVGLSATGWHNLRDFHGALFGTIHCLRFRRKSQMKISDKNLKRISSTKITSKYYKLKSPALCATLVCNKTRSKLLPFLGEGALLVHSSTPARKTDRWVSLSYRWTSEKRRRFFSVDDIWILSKWIYFEIIIDSCKKKQVSQRSWLPSDSSHLDSSALFQVELVGQSSKVEPWQLGFPKKSQNWNFASTVHRLV